MTLRNMEVRQGCSLLMHMMVVRIELNAMLESNLLLTIYA